LSPSYFSFFLFWPSITIPKIVMKALDHPRCWQTIITERQTL